MKFVKGIISERYAKKAAHLMEYACYFVVAFFVFCLILSSMGRQSFRLRTHTETYDRAIYAEDDHATHSRSLFVNTNDNILVVVNDQNQIELTTHIGLAVMYALRTVPLIFAYWFLSKVFSNIHKGQIFTEKNASYLLYYGILQFGAATFAPFLKLLIAYLTNLVSDSTIHISTGQNILAEMFPSIAFIVAAYIIHYGIRLQDEVDHTL